MRATAKRIIGIMLISMVGFFGWGVCKAEEESTLGEAIPLGPSGEIDTMAPTFEWTSVPGATNYCLLVEDIDGVPIYLAWYTDEEAMCMNGEETCNVTPVHVVAGDTWMVMSCADDECGEWSQSAAFPTSVNTIQRGPMTCKDKVSQCLEGCYQGAFAECSQECDAIGPQLSHPWDACKRTCAKKHVITCKTTKCTPAQLCSVSPKPEPSGGPEFALVPHAFVKKIYNSYVDTNTSINSLDSSTGTAITVTSDILDFAALACPALLPVAVLGDVISDVYTDSQVNEELDDIISDINELQDEIDALATELNFLTSAFYTYVSNNAESNAATAYNTFTADINGITDTSTGFYYLFIDKLGIDGSGDIDFTTVFPNIANTNTLLLDDQSMNFTGIINTITSSQLSASADGSDLYEDLTSYDSSDLEELLIQMKYVLYANLPVFNSAVEGVEASSLFKEYNDQIAYIFQLTLGALQAAYAVDAAINMINYQYVLSAEDSGTDPSTQTYLSPLETNLNLYYTYDSSLTSDKNLAAYQSAQKELALVYVERVNYLFELVLSYLVSDQPLEDYSWPSMMTGETLLDNFYGTESYESYYKGTMSTADLDESSTYSTGTQDFPKISTNNGKGYVFYMYDGLNEFASCQASWLNGGDVTCSALYSAYAPAQANTTDETYKYYDGVSLKAWVYSSDTDAAVNTYETNLSNRCNASKMSDNRWDVTSYLSKNGSVAGFSCNSNTSYDTSYFGNTLYTLPVPQDDNLNFKTYNNDNFFGAYFKFVNSSTGGFTYNSDKEIDLSTHSGHMWAIGLETSTGYQTTVGWHYKQDPGYLFNIKCQLYDPLCYYIDNTDGATGEEGLCLGDRFVYIGENQDPSYLNTYYVHDDTGAGSTCENIYYD